MDPITLFRGCAEPAASLARTVTGDQAGLPTPCREWDVAALLDHMAGGPTYLLTALEVEPDAAGSWPDPTAIDRCVDALRMPGALERRCQSPAGFEWSVGEAAAGTAMDQLIHTWDLSVALGSPLSMDPELAEAISALFLPHMPELGRAAGLVGPEVAVTADASVQDRLLGAMGRNPER